jgi:Tol biopolymer transport system component
MSGRCPRIKWLVLTLGAAAVVGSASAGATAPPYTQVVSVSSQGEVGNLYSFDGALSDNGRFVVFTSSASNLVTNDVFDESNEVFKHNLITGRTKRIGLGDEPDISATGRFVTFVAVEDLAAVDTNGLSDVYVRDERTKEVTPLSLGRNPEEMPSTRPSISARGRRVAFESRSPGLLPPRFEAQVGITQQLYVRNTRRGRAKVVSVSTTGRLGNADSFSPEISRTGRYVVFQSDASTLVPRDTNGMTDVFVRDLKTRRTTRTSVNNDETQLPHESHTGTISADGRYVAFVIRVRGDAPDPAIRAGVYVRDRLEGTTRFVGISPSGSPFPDGDTGQPIISANGRYVFFLSGDGESEELYVRDLANGTTQLVTVARDGTPSGAFHSPGDITRNGSHVVFESTATNLVDADVGFFNQVYVRRLK